jgi:NAD(P)H-dependent FMN reductase
VLKNALDSVYATFAFRNTPCASVAYSGGPIGGSRAVEHLTLVAVEAEIVPLPSNILVPYVGAAFEAEGNPTNPRTEAVGRIVLGDLAWRGEAVRGARAEGELSPAMARLMSTTDHR